MAFCAAVPPTHPPEIHKDVERYILSGTSSVFVSAKQTDLKFVEKSGDVKKLFSFFFLENDNRLFTSY